MHLVAEIQTTRHQIKNMVRRNFLKHSTILAMGKLLAPSFVFTACKKTGLFNNLPYDGKVLIVGAGAAGLYAGYILKSLGIDFTILEASSVYGGRMGKLNGFADYAIDTGAQWMHGKNSLIADLVASKKIKTTLHDAELSFWFNQQIVKSLPKDPFIFEATNLPDLSFKEYAQQQGFGTEYNNIIEAIAGDQGASATTLSAYWNYKEEENWVSGDDDYKFNETYFDVIDRYIAQVVSSKISYNVPITSIDYSTNNIVVTDSSNKQHVANKVIITVPIAILKLNEITFKPSLPLQKTTAFSKIGMGPGMKVFLKFNKKFYAAELYGGSVCGAYVDDTLGKTSNNHVLMAFVMGEQATKLNALGTDIAITNALLQELDTIYNGQATTHFITSSVQNFTNKPFIKGAYSYSTIGMGNAREIAAQPVDDKLFFAGEAMNTHGHHQTVHGAIESGYKAVMVLLETLKK